MHNTPASLLNFILVNIVDQPEKVSVNEETDSYGGSVLKINVAQEDMGKVIGKSGKTIRALRNLVKALSIKNSVHTTVTLTEEY